MKLQYTLWKSNHFRRGDHVKSSHLHSFCRGKRQGKCPCLSRKGRKFESNASKGHGNCGSGVHASACPMKIHKLMFFFPDSCWWNMIKCDKFDEIQFNTFPKWMAELFRPHFVFSQDLHRRRPAVDNAMMLTIVVIVIMMMRRRRKDLHPCSTRMKTMTKKMVIMMMVVMMMIKNKLVMK